MNVFDFDNTIYDGESFVDLFKMMLKKDPSLLHHAPKLAYCILRYKVGRLDMQGVYEKYSPVFEQYVAKMPYDFNELAVEFWDKHFCNIKPIFKELLKEDDAVISASPNVIIAEACRRLGVKNYVGSDIDSQSGEIRFMCFGKNKIEAFNKAYPNERIECFYTDSIHDKPLMDISDKVFMVKGSKIKRIK